jgi:hypothetical protein
MKAAMRDPRMTPASAPFDRADPLIALEPELFMMSIR